MCAAIQHLHPQDRPQDAFSSPSGSAGPSTSAIHHDSDHENPTPTPPPMLPSQHPEALPDDPAHDAGAVAHLTTVHGIKVRDFAYENKLPPVATVPRFTVQVQPRPRTLKRTRDMLESAGHEDGEESDEEDPSIPRTFYIDSSSTGASHTYRYRKKAPGLERTLTEPADDQPLPSQGFNTRANFLGQPSRVLWNPSHVLAQPTLPRWPFQGGIPFPTTPSKAASRSSPPALSPISTIPQSQPSMVMESQESEPYVETPLVTPNGSIQWPVQNTSALPDSQLESVLPQLADAANVTMSQLGFTPERSPRNRASTSTAKEESPSRPQRRARQPQLPPPADFVPHASTASKSRPMSGSPTRRAARSGAGPSAPLEEAPAHRYDLRQRAEGAKPAPKMAATSRSTSRTRTTKAATKSEKPPPKKRKVTPPEPSTRTTRGRSKSKSREGKR